MTISEIKDLPVQTKHAILYALQLYRDIEYEVKKLELKRQKEKKN